ncbi:MAG: S-layer homology domain-containing protein [Candidatus Absconditicoccaceae bacterium]
MNLKKLFATTLTVLMVATMFPVNSLKAGYSTELEGAYDYAFSKGSTTMDTIETSNVYGTLIRSHMAKMLSAWGTEVLGLTPDTSKTCEFTDIENQTQEMKDYILESCQLGLMGVGISEFRPNDKVTRAEFGTVLSRALRGDKYDGATPYYADHLEALQDANVMNNISTPSSFEVRGYVRLMMQRADEEGVATPATCKDPMVAIACALNQEDDACPVECRDDVVDPDIIKAGNLDVSLGNTADSATIPALAAGVNIASFDFEAGDEDITVNSLIIKRVGLGDDNSVTNIALFSDNGRITKAKTFNSSTDEATLVLSPALVIKAGGTETVKVVATIGSTTYAGDEFAMQIKEVEAVDSTAEDVNGNFPITAKTMKVASVSAGTVAIATDGTPANVKLGEKGAEILKFKLSENSSANEDIKVSSITFKEVGTIDEQTSLENFALYMGTEKLDTVASISDKYLTFNFDEITITDGNNKKFTVEADIIGGASDTIDFELENDLDITAVGTQYGYGAQVTGRTSFTPAAITVDAGEVTMSYADPTSTEVRKDKDNVELGRFTIASAAGKDLEIQEIKVVIEDQSTGPVNVSTLLENVELYDVKAGTIYDLVSAGAATSETFQDTDVTIPVGTSKTFAIRVDTKDIDLGNAKFVAKLVNLGATNNTESLDIRETSDDTQVTDITPSAITFKAVTAQQSSASVSTIVMSDTTSVIGSNGIEVGQFQLSASSATSLDFSEATVHLATNTAADATRGSAVVTIAGVRAAGDVASVVIGGNTYSFTVVAGSTAIADVVAGLTSVINATYSSLATATSPTITINNLKKGAQTAITSSDTAAAGTATTVDTAGVGTNVSNSQISAVYLMKGTTELDKVSGSQIANGVATFNGFNDTVAKNGKTTYTVKVDLVDDINQDTKHIAASLQTMEIEDDDGDAIVATGLPGHSSRDITITTAGTVVIAVDNTDTETDKVKNVIANTTSPFVASYEITASNEDILIRDLNVVAAGDTTNFVNSVSEVVLYANDKTTEIGREPVTTTTVTFDNIDYVATEGNTNLYAKVVSRKIGKDSAGVQTADITLALQATDVEGDESGKAITAGAGVATPTSASLAFAILPVRVSNIAFVNTYGGETVASQLNNGENVVGIIAVTTDTSTNTKLNGTSLKTELESMKLVVATDAAEYDASPDAGDISAFTVKKINGTIAATTVAQGNGTAMADAVVLSTAGINLFRGVALGADEELENGTTTYYVVKATFSGLGSTVNKYLQLKLENTDAGSVVEYSSTESDDNETYNATDNVTSLRIGSTSVNGPSLSSNY